MPTITATPVVSASPPRVDLTVTGVGSGTLHVTRADPDGRERPVRSAEPATTVSGAWGGADYESWFGAAHTYRATVTTTSGGVSTSHVYATGPVTLDVQAVWLRHPSIPSLSRSVDLYGDGTPTREITQAVLQPIGRSTPVVVSDRVRRLPSAVDYGVRCWTLEERRDLLVLLNDGSPLLLGVPAGWRWGIAWQYLAVGSVAEERLWEEWAPFEGRVFTLSCVTVDRPVGKLRARPAYEDFTAQGWSYAVEKSLYPTYADARVAVIASSVATVVAGSA